MPEEVLTAPTETAAPPATPAPTTDTATATPATPAAQGGDNIRQLREAYEGIKRDFEPWQKLGVKPEQVTQYSTAYQQIRSEAVELGKALGYPENEVEEAIHLNAAQALFLLRKQYDEAAAQQQQEQPDINEIIEQRLQEQLGPIQQRENMRLTDEANARFERTIHQLAAETFKKEGIDIADVSEDERFLLINAASEILKYDEAALKDLKYNGKTGAVQKAFQEAMGYLDKYYLARQARGQARIAPARGAAPGAPPVAKKPSLDEMIDNPSLINAKYK